jgi:hypothetical protein
MNNLTPEELCLVKADLYRLIACAVNSNEFAMAPPDQRTNMINAGHYAIQLIEPLITRGLH